jgi:spore coat protein A, manganese oxidase
VNNAGDTPFTGEHSVEKLYNFTDRIMSFNVSLESENEEQSGVPSWSFPSEDLSNVARVRKVGLFEGKDSFGRLQPLLGGEKDNNIVETFTWSEPITETPALGTIEEWEIFNFSGDAHPMHLHLVAFYVMGRYPIIYDSAADEDHFCGVNMNSADLDGKFQRHCFVFCGLKQSFSCISTHCSLQHH